MLNVKYLVNAQSANTCWCYKQVIVWFCVCMGDNQFAKARGIISPYRHTNHTITSAKFAEHCKYRCCLFYVPVKKTFSNARTISCLMWVESVLSKGFRLSYSNTQQSDFGESRDPHSRRPLRSSYPI